MKIPGWTAPPGPVPGALPVGPPPGLEPTPDHETTTILFLQIKFMFKFKQCYILCTRSRVYNQLLSLVGSGVTYLSV